jgi:hypothetical protein
VAAFESKTVELNPNSSPAPQIAAQFPSCWKPNPAAMSESASPRHCAPQPDLGSTPKANLKLSPVSRPAAWFLRVLNANLGSQPETGAKSSSALERAVEFQP